MLFFKERFLVCLHHMINILQAGLEVRTKAIRLRPEFTVLSGATSRLCSRKAQFRNSLGILEMIFIRGSPKKVGSPVINRLEAPKPLIPWLSDDPEP